MRPKIQILYVDDSPFDRELVQDAINADRSLSLTLTTSRAEFERALESKPYDLVLSDFNILGYDGLRVIKAVKKAQEHVPVIIVTGTGSEEVAVEAMKLGAADYVIKNPKHIIRLPLTIRSVIERNRLETERERLRAELDLFFAVSNDFLLVMDGKGNIRRTNPVFDREFGIQWNDSGTISISDIIVSEDRSTVTQLMERAQNSRNPVRFMVRCQRGDDSIRWIEWNVFHSNGPDRMFSIGRDVTDNRKYEAEERERSIAAAKFSMLSPRERQVLRLVVAGKANKQIASHLGLSEKTIEKHRSHGMKKLGLRSVPDLVRIAILAEPK